MPPPVWNFILTTGGALMSLPCVRGGAARRAAEGLYLIGTIFLFCSANFIPLQSLRRCRASSLYTREPFLFVRTLQKSFAVSAGRGHMECPPTGLDFCRNGGRPPVACAPIKITSAGVWVSPPAVRNFHPAFRRRTPEPALCKGRRRENPCAFRKNNRFFAKNAAFYAPIDRRGAFLYNKITKSTL